MTAIALTRWEWGLWPTLAFVLAVALCLPLVLGAVSLRVGGIAFAMVTLAFAQAGQVLVQKNPYGWTGGEEGTGLNYDEIPDAFVGVLNTKNLYWLALGYAVLVFIVVRLAVGSSAGHVWRAVRENEPRVHVLGLNPYPFKLIAFVVAGFLAVLGGIVWLLLIGGALAALAGVLSGVYFGVVDPGRGTSLLIFAFIVVVIGGFGSIGGSAVAAVAVGLIQQYANYYASSGTGDLAVVLLLALVLLVRPSGLAPKVAH
jgi:ABC-type branched-subunit amino acid transport system permease subunit